MSKLTTFYQCKSCKLNKKISEFYKKSSYRFGINTTNCKLCLRNYEYQRKCTPMGYLNKVKCNAKRSQMTRYIKRGLHPPVFSLTTQYLYALYSKQNGKGFHSLISLNLRPLSDWQVSLERLDPYADYVLDNVILEALEFNVRKQWFADKIDSIPSMIHAPTNVTLSDLYNARSPDNAAKPTRRKALFQNGLWYCYECKGWMSNEYFYAHHLTLCILCYKGYRVNYVNSLRGYVKRMVHNAGKSSKKRKSTGNDTRNECTITERDIFDLLEQQMFRCKYSGIPMSFKINSDWMCSLERINNMKSYNKNNCALICWEFNSSDRTIHAVNPVFGSSQWSEAKFQYFFKTRFGSHVPNRCNS
eukprot:143086_1